MRHIWDQLIPQFTPRRVLEIGSFEGRSTCYLIENLTAENAEIHCIDSFAGGVEHLPGGFFEAQMSQVERRFKHNIDLALSRSAGNVAVHVHKGSSDVEMARMLAGGMGAYFDFIYVDGSHEAPEVLCDALLAFRLARVGGYIGFDDYIWQEPLPTVDLLRCPKIAIDAFVNVYRGKLKILNCPNTQVYVQKLAE